MLVRAGSAQAIRARGGLQIEGGPIFAADITDDTRAFYDVEAVLVAVKAQDTIAALQALRDVLPAATPIVTLQNGLDAVVDIERALGKRSALALAPTTEAALLLEPGYVRHTGVGLTTLGWAAARDGGSWLDEFAARLQRSGLAATVVRPIESHVWAKAVVNAAINPLGALAGAPNGALLERPELALRLFAIAREAEAVARAAGIELPFDDAAVYVADVVRATAANRSSMLQDIERGRPTEIEQIDGAIVRAARPLGVAVPETARVLDEVRARTKA